MEHCTRTIPGLRGQCNHEAAWEVSCRPGVTGFACRRHLSMVAEQLGGTQPGTEIRMRWIWEPAVLSDPRGRIET